MNRVSFRLTGFLLSGLLLLFQSGDLCAHTQDQQSQWPNERERGSYQAKITSTGKLLWQVHWETKVTKEQGRSRVEIVEQGRGTPWRVKETLVWKKELRFEEGPFYPALQVQSVSGYGWTRDGRLFNEMDIQMDPVLGQISYRNAETGKRSQNTVLPWTPQSIPDEMLFYWVRTLPFQEVVGPNHPDSEFTLVVSPTRQFRIKAQIQGTEMVTTPAGRFSCYRIVLVPQLPGPLKVLAPRMSLWCRTEPPNYWVRYQGPVGGPGSPEAVIELVEFEQG